MNISIEVTTEIKDYLDYQVKKGYKSRSEVVRDAIRRMIKEEIRHEARKKNITLKDLEKTRDDVAKELLTTEKYSHYL